jgi:hypothetical protein
LQGQDHAGEEPGEQYDPERLDPDLIHLLDEVLRVERTHEREAQRLTGQAEVLLDGSELVLGGVGESRGQCGQNGGPAVGVRRWDTTI